MTLRLVDLVVWLYGRKILSCLYDVLEVVSGPS